MKSFNKIFTILISLIEYIFLILNIVIILILTLQYGEYIITLNKADYFFRNEYSEMILIALIILLVLSLILMILNKIRALSITILFLFFSSYAYYLYYNLYILYDSCTCKSLITLLSIHVNYYLSIIMAVFAVMVLFYYIYDKNTKNIQKIWQGPST
jgi:hypothetical protein